MADARVCVGLIAGAHGVRGLVRVKSYTARPEDIVAYGPLTDETGERRFAFSLTGRSKGALLARIDGIADRNAAQALHGTRLFVARAALPALAEADDYYQADLIGLAAEDAAGRRLGRVAAVHNFGAGDLLEIAGPDGRRFLPFTQAIVPQVDLAGGRLVIVPPDEVEAGKGQPDAEDS